LENRVVSYTHERISDVFWHRGKDSFLGFGLIRGSSSASAKHLDA